MLLYRTRSITGGNRKKRSGFLNMKRIYLFGRIVRISFLISFIFLNYAFIDMYIQSNFSFKNLLLLIFIIAVTVWMMIWIYSMGLFIDRNNETLKLVTGFSKKETKVLALGNVSSIDVELNGNRGMNFIIYYKHDCVERIEYKFYRISIVEKLQYKRLKKQLNKIKYSLSV